MLFHIIVPDALLPFRLSVYLFDHLSQKNSYVRFTCIHMSLCYLSGQGFTRIEVLTARR